MVLGKKYISLFILLALPLAGFSQIHERSMMKNRTNVEKESSDYSLGIFRDTAKYQSLIQFIDYDDNDDDAALSEEDIVYESFDNKIVHYLKKFDYNSMSGSIPIRLTDEKKRQYYTCPLEGPVTSHFGPRRRRFHYGTDIGMPTGTPVVSMFDGVVRYAKWSNGYGNLIVVRHDNGLETYYGHLSKYKVVDNQRVKAGEVIGLVGSTGRSTGPHLHLEIRYLGSAMNPEHFIDFTDYRLKCEREVYNITRNDFKPGATHNVSTSNVQLARSRTKASRSGSASYKIRKGETLSEIARKNGTTVQKLARLNGIKGTKIRAGQKIKVK